MPYVAMVAVIVNAIAIAVIGAVAVAASVVVVVVVLGCTHVFALFFFSWNQERTQYSTV